MGEYLMAVYAVSDIHSPKYYSLFVSRLEEIKVEDAALFLLAGDIIERGKWHECLKVQNMIVRTFPNAKIIGVFGNEEYDEVHSKLRAECSYITWLDDEKITLQLGGLKVTIIGSRGVLDKPTSWQEKNIPNIRQIYEERLRRIEELIKGGLASNTPVILLTHYPPRCRTLKGEKPMFWSQMSSRKLSGIIEKYGIDLVVHGHLHNSEVHEDRIGRTRILNVALPATGKISSIPLSLKRTLLDFM